MSAEALSYDVELHCGCRRWLMNVLMDHLRVFCEKHERMTAVSAVVPATPQGVDWKQVVMTMFPEG